MADVTLGRAAPTIPVRDMARARRFYTSAFGLEVTFSQADLYVVMKKDAAEVHLSVCSDPAPRSQNVMHLIVSDAMAVERAAKAAGGEIVEALRDAPWGMRIFVVADPDGHRIDVGQPLGEE
ncbi:MAG: VOC family protein [Myxococcota bacterium]|nr:VOC family protein [Myxococcota bacterium]